jgi:hypothetical protein
MRTGISAGGCRAGGDGDAGEHVEDRRDVYQMLIYSKGAYILHMLEMLYWSPQYGDAQFKAGNARLCEQLSQPAGDDRGLQGSDGTQYAARGRTWTETIKLDWFFDAYVYGTEVPKYTYRTN